MKLKNDVASNEKLLHENARLRAEVKKLMVLLEQNNEAVKIMQNRARNFIADLNNCLMYNDKK